MKSLLIKFIMTLVVLWIVLGWIYGVSFTDVLITSVVLTGVGYIADVYILPRIGNVFASIADFGLALVLIWLVGSYLFEPPVPLWSAAFLSALIIMLGELFFHRYMANNVFDKEISDPKDKKGYFQRTNLQTEFGEDMDIESAAKKAEKEKEKKKK
jgi:hypothetical protein